MPSGRTPPASWRSASPTSRICRSELPSWSWRASHKRPFHIPPRRRCQGTSACLQLLRSASQAQCRSQQRRRCPGQQSLRGHLTLLMHVTQLPPQPVRPCLLASCRRWRPKRRLLPLEMCGRDAKPCTPLDQTLGLAHSVIGRGMTRDIRCGMLGPCHYCAPFSVSNNVSES